MLRSGENTGGGFRELASRTKRKEAFQEIMPREAIRIVPILRHLWWNRWIDEQKRGGRIDTWIALWEKSSFLYFEMFKSSVLDWNEWMTLLYGVYCSSCCVCCSITSLNSLFELKTSPKVIPQAIRSASFCSFWLGWRWRRWMVWWSFASVSPYSCSTFSHSVFLPVGLLRVGEKHQIRLCIRVVSYGMVWYNILAFWAF